MTETIPVVENNAPTQLGGKKKNGHKANCNCPICINMKHAKRSKYSKRRKHHKRGKTRRKRGGANSPDIDSESDSDLDSESDSDSDNVEEADDDEEAVNVEEADEDEDATSSNIPTTSSETDGDVRTEGGRKKKKRNGHKANCKCPICKNMRKGKRGGEGESEGKGNEVKATEEEYDALMEGGKRKRTRRHKKHRKTHKRHRKRTRRHRRH
jgi:hypothetical protein